MIDYIFRKGGYLSGQNVEEPKTISNIYSSSAFRIQDCILAAAADDECSLTLCQCLPLVLLQSRAQSFAIMHYLSTALEIADRRSK